jgi:hypothetical protein
VRGHQRLPGLRTLKVTLATVLAYLAAEPLPGPDPPVVAALTALLVVQLTFYQTVRSGWQRVGSVVTGVLVAVVLSEVLGLTWWSLGLAVLAALVLGQWLRLGGQAVETPISAMVVLAVGAHTQIGLGRVYETLIGAAVGVSVSLLTPPVYVQPAGDAIGELAGQISRLLRTVAAELEDRWAYERAVPWLERARELEGLVRQARDALVQAEESLRLNPRSRGAEHVPGTLRSGLTALEYTAINVRVVCRLLVDRVQDVPPRDLPGPRIRRPLARLLAAAAEPVAVFGELVASDVAGPAPDDERLRQALRRARLLRDAASRVLLVDALRKPDIWRVHGALLAFIDRVLSEIDPDAENAEQAIKRTRPAVIAGTPLPQFLGSLARRRAASARRRIRRAGRTR